MHTYCKLIWHLFLHESCQNHVFNHDFSVYKLDTESNTKCVFQSLFQVNKQYSISALFCDTFVTVYI